MDAHSGYRGRAGPKAGDATVCLYCGAVMIYADAALTMRAATPDEIAEVERDAPNALADARRMNRLYRQFVAERN
jgi:hypothetical protein